MSGNPGSATATDQHQEKHARPPEMLGPVEETCIPCLEGINKAARGGWLGFTLFTRYYLGH